MAATVFIVDDDPGLRAALVRLFQSVGLPSQPCASAQEFLQTCTPEALGCIILDVRMPGMSGLELQSELRARGIKLPVIMISGYADVAVVTRAFNGGAFEFVEKPFSDQCLLEIVGKAMALDEERHGLRKARAAFQNRLAGLTQREREILEMVVAGKPNKVIAVDCSVSQRTVEVHRAHIMQKMGVTGLGDLVRTMTAARIARADDDAQTGDSSAYARAVRAELGESPPQSSEEEATPPDDATDR